MRRGPQGKEKDSRLRIEETFSADVKNIDPLVQRVVELAREMHCDEGKDMEIALALQEALAITATAKNTRKESSPEPWSNRVARKAVPVEARAMA